MRVLLAEDDPGVSTPLVKRLEENDFIVDLCVDGAEAMRLGLENDYAVVLLDPGLPTFGGEMIMARWKKAERRFPVIVITGTRYVRDDVKELIRLGVDQYVGKPILDYDILIDWVKSRANSSQSGVHGAVIKRGDLELDTDHLSTRYKGKRIELSPAQFSVLRALALNERAPLTAKAIAARCFDDIDGTKEMAVRVHIARIREKVGANVIVSVGAAQGYALAT